MRVLKITFFILVLGFFGGISYAAPLPPGNLRITLDTEIIVHAESIFATKSLQGFLNGVGFAATESFDASVVSPLKPKFWRIPDFAYYDKIRQFNPAFTFILGEAYANAHGGWNNARPWENWKEWEDFVIATVKHSITTNRPVAYWDMWGEPDIQGGTKWQGTYPQFLEFVARGYRAIHIANPSAKVIGPSFAGFDSYFQDASGPRHYMGDVVKDLATIHNVKLEGISWHELGSNPEDLPKHKDIARQFFAQNFPGYTPEIHINEFSAQADHTIPGWAVAWLYYLEQAGVDAASRACWFMQTTTDSSTWNNCWAGLDGLLLQDNKTPQHTYWVHKAYADLGPRRLVIDSGVSKIVALASRDDSKQELRILLGRYQTRAATGKAAPKDMSLIVENYPYQATQVQVTASLIPDETPGALLKPLQGSQTFLLQGRTLILPLNSFKDGDAGEVVITPLP